MLPDLKVLPFRLFVRLRRGTALLGGYRFAWRLSLCCRDQALDEVVQLHAGPAAAQRSRTVDVRKDAVAVERAGIANRRAVRGGGARDYPFAFEIGEPCDASPVHAAAGIAEEHRVN